MAVVGEDHRRLAVVDDVGDLVAVEAGVHGHRHEAGVPDAEHRLQVLGAIAHDDRHAITGCQAEAVAQAGCHRRRSAGERSPRRVH
ncbi:MAG: hypothetical protein MUE78_05025, partial [Ilumatobacteraceae bacterium]|nr:hypothetical protein [Ilumatobacteraceae bacterium]